MEEQNKAKPKGRFELFIRNGELVIVPHHILTAEQIAEVESRPERQAALLKELGPVVSQIVRRSLSRKEPFLLDSIGPAVLAESPDLFGRFCQDFVLEEDEA